MRDGGVGGGGVKTKQSNRHIQSSRYLEEGDDEGRAKLTDNQHDPQCPEHSGFQHLFRTDVGLLYRARPGFSLIVGVAGPLVVDGRWYRRFWPFWWNQWFRFADNWCCGLNMNKSQSFRTATTIH